MRLDANRLISVGTVSLAVVLSAVWLGASAAPSSTQDAKPAQNKQDDKADKTDKTAKTTTSKKRPGGLRVPVGRVPKDRPEPAADPLKADAADKDAAADAKAEPKNKARPPRNRNAAVNPNLPQVPLWPFHYTFKLAGSDGTALSAEYYPARQTFEAPVVILLHESGTGRGGKDFAQPIDDLNGLSFARHMQRQGYAVFVLHLRAPSASGRNAAYSVDDWRLMIADVQCAYRFLVDRHNRGELNLAKLGVVALGDGANLAAAWAGSPSGGVSNEGRLSDIGALALVSPVVDVPGLTFARTLPTIATRFPLLALSGDRDQASIQAVRDNQRVIERHRLSRTAYYDTSLHGGKMLTFYPKIALNIERFLDDPVKNRKVEWEPRFLLDPVPYENIELVPDSGFDAPRAEPNRAAAKDAPAKKDAAKAQPEKAAEKGR